MNKKDDFERRKGVLGYIDVGEPQVFTCVVGFSDSHGLLQLFRNMGLSALILKLLIICSEVNLVSL